MDRVRQAWQQEALFQGGWEQLHLNVRMSFNGKTGMLTPSWLVTDLLTDAWVGCEVGTPVSVNEVHLQIRDRGMAGVQCVWESLRTF